MLVKGEKECEACGGCIVTGLPFLRTTTISALDTKSHGEDIWEALGVECPQVLLLSRTTCTTLPNAYPAFPAMTSHPDSWDVSPSADFYTFQQYQDCLLCTLYKVTNMDPWKKSYSAGFDIDLYTLFALTSFGCSTGIVQVSK